MAADQRRKRMSSANVIDFSSREHYRAKRKKIGSPDGALRSGDHISLEWDRNRNKVVSKKDQVGLSFRHLREFVDFAPPRRNILAQVCPVPNETFQLENLSEVLSSEVWRGCLSDGERDYLRQFLPEGVDVEQGVQALLDGENFHFGNPFLDWGKAVCSSKVHPDQVVSREERLRAGIRRYYSDLDKYHHDIIDYLKTLKEKWESCKDPEKDAVKKMWGRSRRGSAHVNGRCQDLTAASESSSWDADDKPCSSENKISDVVRTGEVQRRPKSTAVKKEKSQSPLIARDNAVNVAVKARKNDKIPKHSIQQTDGAKYMSYLKISKKQHQIVTSMQQSGKSIQSRQLNRILGNINNLDVQPYGMFVEEEHNKLKAHWLQLVKALPATYAIWQKLQLQKRDIINSVGKELKEKLNPSMEDKQKLDTVENPLQKHDVQLHSGNNDSKSLNPNQSVDLVPYDEDSETSSEVSGKNHSPSKDSTSYDDQITDSGRCLQVDTYPSHVSSEDCDNSIKLEEDIEEKQYSSPRSPSRCHVLQETDVEGNDYSSSAQGQSLPQASFPSDPHVTDLVKVSSDERIPCIASSHGEESQLCSGGDWQPVGGVSQSYIGRQAYTPSGGFSVIHHPEGIGEEKSCFIDLESSDMPEEVDRRKMLQQKANNSFGSFPNNDQNELLQSLFKGQGVASRIPEQQLQSLLKVPEHKQIMGIGFQQQGSNNLMEGSQGVASRTPEQQLHSLFKVPLNEEHKQIMGIGFQQEGRNNLMEGSQFSGQFQDQMPAPLALSQDQQRQIDVYGQGNMAGNIYCDARGFLMQQRPDWNTSAQIGVTTQPQLNTVPLLNQNWQFRSMWANTNGGVGLASQTSQSGTERDQSLLRVATNTDQIIHRGSSSDQSLFSVLTQCNQLRQPRTAFEPESTSGQVVASGNYGMPMGGVTTHVSSNLVQPTSPLDYLSGSNPTTSLMPDDVVWMNQNRQNSGLHDQLGKLYPRSWNP